MTIFLVISATIYFTIAFIHFAVFFMIMSGLGADGEMTREILKSSLIWPWFYIRDRIKK